MPYTITKEIIHLNLHQISPDIKTNMVTTTTTAARTISLIEVN